MIRLWVVVLAGLLALAVSTTRAEDPFPLCFPCPDDAR